MENRLYETLKRKAAKFDEITLDELTEMVSDPDLRGRLEDYEMLGYSLNYDVTVKEDNGEMNIDIYNYFGLQSHKVTVGDNVEEAINNAARILLKDMDTDVDNTVAIFSGDIYGEELEEDGETLFCYDECSSNYTDDYSLQDIVLDILEEHRAELNFDPDDLELVYREGQYRHQRVVA